MNSNAGHDDDDDELYESLYSDFQNCIDEDAVEVYIQDTESLREVMVAFDGVYKLEVRKDQPFTLIHVSRSSSEGGLVGSIFSPNAADHGVLRFLVVSKNMDYCRELIRHLSQYLHVQKLLIYGNNIHLQTFLEQPDGFSFE